MEPSVEQLELLGRVVGTLERLDIPFLVTGSIASIFYGEPRFTNDIDIVADISNEHIPGLLEAFPLGDFYLAEESVRRAVAKRGQFNVIHPRSGLKIDIMIPVGDDFDASRFSRARQVQAAPDLTASFASPEDVIVKKLEYFREGGSEKHLRDIAGILAIGGEEIDLRYIAHWAGKRGLLKIWERIPRES